MAYQCRFGFSFQLYHAACRILVSQPGSEPACLAVEMWSLNYWTTREDPLLKLIVVPYLLRASVMAQMVKNLLAVWETLVQSLGREDPLEEEMATHSRILAWRFHGQRSLVTSSPWGRKESDTTERLILSL